MGSALEDRAFVILAGRVPSVMNPIVRIQTAAVMAPACPASVTARQAGRVNDAIRSISRCISVYQVVRTMARTTSNLPRASAKNIGLGSIVHNPVVAWTVVLMDRANRVVANVMTIGLERNAIRNHVIHVVLNMANVRTELAYVVKDGMEDIVLCLDARMVALDTDCARCRTASTVANAQSVGLAETVA